MQLVNGAQFLNITFLLVLFATAPAADVLSTIIVPLTRMYASLYSHKLDFSVAVLNLICLLALYVPSESSFISAQFFVLTLDR